MHLTWHLILIIAAVLLGACLFQKGEKNPNMSDAQVKEADMYRNYSYLLFGIAVVTAVYYYFIMPKSKKSRMNGYNHYGNGNSYTNHANMCGKAHY